LEAKLVTSAGHAISLASEFIENPSGLNFEKQDCEQKAFARLSSKIKKYFPRLPICILADGLYPNNTVFDICRKNGWAFIITLKDTCLKTFQTEVKLLHANAINRQVYRRDSTDNILLEYSYINDIEYNENFYHWVYCKETKTNHNSKENTEKTFIYITNIKQSVEILIQTADGGRLRWKIENQGFNTQKNNGYELGHKYSRVSYTALKNYYLILQIAHVINKLTEKSNDVVNLVESHAG
jgi:hypothetical protein